VKLPSRRVRIDELEVLSYKYPELVIRVKCSSGTYIRTLAQDIGEALRRGAYLVALRRTQVGEYRVEDAHGIDFYA
jgi:tRNA pseudouridine55 synthase